MVRERELKLLLCFRAARSFVLVVPILVPFFLAQGLSFTQIFLLESIWACTVLLNEFPCGHFADQFGRRKSLILGSFFSLLGYGLLAYAASFQWFMVCQILLGLGFSFISGADVSFLYDLLIDKDRRSEYLKYESISTSLNHTVRAVAQYMACVVALIDYRVPLTFQVVVSLLVLLLSFVLVEPVLESGRERYSHREALWRIKRLLTSRPTILWLILYRSTVFNMTLHITWLITPLLLAADFELQQTGVVWAVYTLLIAVSAQFVRKQPEQVSVFQILLALLVLGVCAYFSLGFLSGVAIVPVLLLFPIIRGACKPILFDAVNAKIASPLRATMLSFDSIVRKLVYAIVCPVIGLAIDFHSISGGMICSAFIYGALGGFALMQLRKSSQQ